MALACPLRQCSCHQADRAGAWCHHIYFQKAARLLCLGGSCQEAHGDICSLGLSSPRTPGGLEHHPITAKFTDSAKYKALLEGNFVEKSQ